MKSFFDSSRYDCCIYSSSVYQKSLILKMLILFGLFVFLGSIKIAVNFFYQGRIPEFQNVYDYIRIIGPGFMALLIFMYLGVIWRMLLVGIRKEGLYIRWHGTISWDNIKTIDCQTKKNELSTFENDVVVYLYDPVSFLARRPFWYRLLNKKVIKCQCVTISARMIALGSSDIMSDSGLIALLREPKSRYTQ